MKRERLLFFFFFSFFFFFFGGGGPMEGRPLASTHSSILIRSSQAPNPVQGPAGKSALFELGTCAQPVESAGSPSCLKMTIDAPKHITKIEPVAANAGAGLLQAPISIRGSLSHSEAGVSGEVLRMIPPWRSIAAFSLADGWIGAAVPFGDILLSHVNGGLVEKLDRPGGGGGGLGGGR